MLNNWAQLYGDSLTHVSDVAEELGKAQGGFYNTSKVVANDGKRWIAVPWSIVGRQIAYRKSWFEELGYSDGKFPETREALREAGKKLKARAGGGDPRAALVGRGSKPGAGLCGPARQPQALWTRPT